MNQRVMVRSSCFSRGAICRAVAIAASLSVPQTSCPSGRAALLKEARETVQWIMSWNVRGLGRKDKRGKILKLVKDKKLDMLLLQETKKSNVDELLVKSLRPLDSLQFLAVDSVGSAGGLLRVWNPGGSVMGSIGKAEVIFSQTLVYWRGFNEIRFLNERRSFLRRDKGMIEFNEFIERMEFLDLPVLVRGFTWCNSVEGDRWSRIDRFLLDSLWLEKFSLKQWGLPRSFFDHCPLVLIEDERDWGPRPFRFLNAWSLHPTFMAMEKKSWTEAETYGWAGFRLKERLASLKMALKKWNVEDFGNVDLQLKSAEEELHEIDLKAEVGPFLDTEIGGRRELRSLVWKLKKRLGWIWQQKSRIKWAQDGDKNMRFFHVMVKRRQAKNLIDTVVQNGEVIGEPKRVKQVVVGHFRKLYFEEWKSRSKLDGPFITIGDDEAKRDLEVEFTLEEVWAAVKDCDGNKAPGPDGFNLYCIQKNWEVMRSEIL
ncbi:uncharacterized protein LOC114272166 [Camellia sinensis]|uniref:uncharacterized protein LOC114272166 n=1 Tax=Camellia sinensis TaxID=4442 RepID=UPI0010358203|nr:uncharacterized protein LOC114272166 [Camellia sinensis]